MTELQGSFEVHQLPSGATVFYRDSDHSYFSRIEERASGKWVGPRDARLPSPSTIGKMLDTNTEPLLRWAARKTCEGVVQLDHIPPDGDDLWGVLCGRKLTYKDLRDQRATEGTNVHTKVLEALAEGGAVPSLSDVQPEERGMAQGVLAWWQDRNPTTIAVEQVVYSQAHNYAGRFDLLCELEGEVVLVDLKTSKFIGNGAHTQLAGYIYAAEESGFGPIASARILQVFADGTYREHECAASVDQFLAALAAHRAAKEIGKRSRELAKAAA